MSATVCAGCGGTMPPASGNRARKWCSDACRKRYSGSKGGRDVPQVDSGLVDATRQELEAVDRAGTMLGQQALTLAALIAAGRDSGSGVAALSKELRAVMERAMADVAVEDPMDELRARRERKRAAAG